MYVRFQVKKSTKLKTDGLIQTIESALADQDFTIISASENLISFENKNWLTGPRGDYFKKVEKGKIEILVAADGKAIIKCTYYLSFIIELAMVMISILIAYNWHNFFLLLMTLLLIFQFVIRIVFTRDAAKDMLDEIISTSETNAIAPGVGK